MVRRTDQEFPLTVTPIGAIVAAFPARTAIGTHQPGGGGIRVSDKRLLVVDDELGFREFVGKVAASAGYEVEVTSNAREFMRLYESFDPTLIVMDMILPEMDGFELMQWLIRQNCRSRVLVVTGYNPHYAEMAETIGTDAGKLDVETLTKPIGLMELRAALN